MHPYSITKPITRRRALQALGAALLSGAAGQLLLSTRARAALASATPGLNDFIEVSRSLTAQPALDATLAHALYAAFRRSAPDIDTALAALKTTLAQGAALAQADKTAFGDEEKAQEALSQAILQAWYLGVVGKGGKAACVTYVDALANRAVEGILVPPSYSYGHCGTWQAKP